MLTVAATSVLAMKEQCDDNKQKMEELKARIKKLNEEVFWRDKHLAENQKKMELLISTVALLQKQVDNDTVAFKYQENGLAKQQSVIKKQEDIIKKYEGDIEDFSNALNRTVSLNLALKSQIFDLRVQLYDVINKDNS